MLPAHKLTVRHYEDKQKLAFPQLRGDAAIVQFPGDNGSALCAMAMESAGKRMFVEVDDNYLSYGDELWMKRAAWSERISGKNPHSAQGHRWIVEHSHGVIVTTRALAAEYGKLNDNVHVCRNSIDPSDWPKSERNRDGIFRIGWYASVSHDRDAVMVRSALSWASRQPNVEIVNIGYDPAWGFARRQVAWTDNFIAQRQELCRLDLGVAPIVSSPLAKYRSDLKALEYAMGGAMPVLQSSEPYWEWRDFHIFDPSIDSGGGFAALCHTPDDWMRAIKWAVRNQDEVRARAQQAREYVLAERTFKTEIEKWRVALGS